MSKAKYAEGEKVLCFHGPLLYEAKCLQVDVKEGQLKYFVHYQGWNKNWDEWVTDARMMKFNAVGLQKQKELKEIYSKSGKKLRKCELQKQSYPLPESLLQLEKKKSAQDAEAEANSSSAEASTEPTTTETTVGRKRKESTPAPSSASGVDGGVCSAGPLKRLRSRLELPRRLRLWLADDADFVNAQLKLVRLPPRPDATVDAVVRSFLHHRLVQCDDDDDHDDDDDEWRQFADGLLCLFNASLGGRLLYKFERPQLAELLRTRRHSLPAALYGCQHLLRLLARLQDLLPMADGVSAAGADRLLRLCRVFLRFLEQHCESYMSEDCYEVATPQYQRLALCS